MIPDRNVEPATGYELRRPRLAPAHDTGENSKMISNIAVNRTRAIALAVMLLGALPSFAAMGQSRVGEWAFLVEREAEQEKRRIALTAAQAYVGSEPTPKLILRREASDDAIELLIIDTHNVEKDKCEYKDWKLVIDKTDIPVLGYSFEPSKTLLKASWGASQDELWELFRKGYNLALEAQVQCDSSVEVRTVNFPFSLRGSSAALKFIQAGIE